jgi:predicted CopG family antitoxin
MNNEGVNRDHHKPYVYSYSKESVFPVVKDEDLIELYKKEYQECKDIKDKRFYNIAIRSLEKKLYEKPITPLKHGKNPKGSKFGVKKMKRVEVTDTMRTKLQGIVDRFETRKEAFKDFPSLNTYAAKILECRIDEVLITIAKHIDTLYEKSKHRPLLDKDPMVPITDEIYNKVKKLHDSEESDSSLQRRMKVSRGLFHNILKCNQRSMKESEAKKILAYE